MRIDRLDGDNEHPDAAAQSTGNAADTGRGGHEVRAASLPGDIGKRDDGGRGGDPSAGGVECNLEYRATVDAVNRAYAIDQG